MIILWQRHSRELEFQKAGVHCWVSIVWTSLWATYYSPDSCLHLVALLVIIDVFLLITLSTLALPMTAGGLSAENSHSGCLKGIIYEMRCPISYVPDEANIIFGGLGDLPTILSTYPRIAKTRKNSDPGRQLLGHPTKLLWQEAVQYYFPSHHSCINTYDGLVGFRKTLLIADGTRPWSTLRDNLRGWGRCRLCAESSENHGIKWWVRCRCIVVHAHE